MTHTLVEASREAEQVEKGDANATCKITHASLYDLRYWSCIAAIALRSDVKRLSRYSESSAVTAPTRQIASSITNTMSPSESVMIRQPSSFAQSG